MGLFEAAMKICHDCDRDDRPLEWSRDGNTKICAECRERRGEREIGPPSARAAESAALEAAVRRGDSEAATSILADEE